MWSTVVTSRRTTAHALPNPRRYLKWCDEIPLKYEYVPDNNDLQLGSRLRESRKY